MVEDALFLFTDLNDFPIERVNQNTGVIAMYLWFISFSLNQLDSILYKLYSSFNSFISMPSSLVNLRLIFFNNFTNPLINNEGRNKLSEQEIIHYHSPKSRKKDEFQYLQNKFNALKKNPKMRVA